MLHFHAVSVIKHVAQYGWKIGAIEQCQAWRNHHEQYCMKIKLIASPETAHHQYHQSTPATVCRKTHNTSVHIPICLLITNQKMLFCDNSAAPSAPFC